MAQIGHTGMANVLHFNRSDDILPALRKAGVSEEQIDQMLVRNPRAIFEARQG